MKHDGPEESTFACCWQGVRPAKTQLEMCHTCETASKVIVFQVVLVGIKIAVFSLLGSILHPCCGAALVLRTEWICGITIIRPKGRWTDKTCWLPCCARVLVEDQEAVVAAAAVVVAVEPNCL